MGNIKKRYSPAFKAKVAMEAIKSREPISAICSRYSLHPTQANRWKDRALESMTAGFNNRIGTEQKKKDELIEELYKQIGQLKVEMNWLKKYGTCLKRIVARSSSRIPKYRSPVNVISSE